MPRFAANLGFTPLEPMRPTSEHGLLRPTPAAGGVASGGRPAPPSSVLDVPAAQFDWSGAGLVNPLDGKLTTGRDRLVGVCVFCIRLGIALLVVM